jgi:ATP-dependent DNA helicase RecQ
LNKQCVIVTESPNRSNIFYCFQYFNKSLPLDLLFDDIIKEIQINDVTAKRVIIYCQTRKQCGILYKMFEVSLGIKFYKGSSPKPTRRLVEMYHAGTPSSVKKHISKNLSKPDGHIRVLIATIAFGMGVNCKNVQSIIHFGPSKSIECYVQESGRAGRDGSRSNSIVLYHGMLLSHCSQEMKELVLDEDECRRKVLMKAFGYDCQELQPKHNCCDNCVKVCQCLECPSHVGLQVPAGEDSCSRHTGKIRSVTDADRLALKDQLKQYHDAILKEHARVMSNTVSIPSAIIEFGSLQMKQILDNCNKMFSLGDVTSHVDVWRKCQAIGILKVINNVFGDIGDIDEVSQLEHIEMDEDCPSIWNETVEESSFLSFGDSQDFEVMESECTLESEESAHNSSSFLFNLTNTIK